MDSELTPLSTDDPVVEPDGCDSAAWLRQGANRYAIGGPHTTLQRRFVLSPPGQAPTTPPVSGVSPHTTPTSQQLTFSTKPNDEYTAPPSGQVAVQMLSPPSPMVTGVPSTIWKSGPTVAVEPGAPVIPVAPVGPVGPVGP